MANSTLNGFNVGTDASISIADPFGDVFPAEALAHVTDFDAESEDVDLKITPLSLGGVPVYQTIWNGLRGRMGFVRVNGAFQSMFIGLMEAYYETGLLPMFTITETVRNRDGSTDEYLYFGCQFARPNFGNFAATKEVDFTVEFRAQRMIATGALTPFLSALPTIGAQIGL